MAAFAEVGAEAGWELAALMAARATPSGLVEAGAYAAIRRELLEQLQAALPVDGVLLALHGAMGAEGVPDCEGDLLAAVRELVGPGVPVMATLDLHANVTAAMVQAATALIGYRTYPHVDQYERGQEAARLLARTLAGEVEPVMVRVAPPALLTSMNMRTESGPMAELVVLAEAAAAEPGLLSASVFGGYPYADFPEVGATAVAVADGSREAAERTARELARAIWERRRDFAADLLGPEEAVVAAQRLLAEGGSGQVPGGGPAPAQAGGADPPPGRRAGPVALVDVTDNPASGGTGDTTGLLAAMVAAGLENAAFGTLWDPESVARCAAAGVGAEVELELGGKSNPEFGGPVPVRARVRTLADGRFRNKGPMNRGVEVQMGLTAVVQVGGLQVVLTEHPVAPIDPESFRRVGIDPAGLAVLGIKAKNHFRAAYGPFLSEVILVHAPGLATLDLTILPYRHLRRPVWPLDPELTWDG